MGNIRSRFRSRPKELDDVVLFYPYVPPAAVKMVSKVLGTRWIGQGPLVDEFESNFGDYIGSDNCISVGSGTDALHLAYLLAGIEAGDEVICPVFTCTATNIPLLYIGATPVFADIDPKTMNIDTRILRSLITNKTKAIVTVDYGGLPCDYREIMQIANEFGLKVIDDAAHALGATYQGSKIGTIADFTTYSFQAIKQITTGDGGMLVVRDPDLVAKARRLRWFGIDRVAKFGGIWSNDIQEVGYKYQMTDIAAAMGLAGISNIEEILSYRRRLLNKYFEVLSDIPGLYNVGSDALNDRNHAAWLHTVIVEERNNLQAKLKEHNVESAPVHFRNDMYSIFGGRKENLPMMDSIEKKYLVLPLHMKVSMSDIDRIGEVIKSGW